MRSRKHNSIETVAMERVNWTTEHRSGQINFYNIANVFCDSDRMILIDFSEREKTSTNDYYEVLLQKLESTMVKKDASEVASYSIAAIRRLIH